MHASVSGRRPAVHIEFVMRATLMTASSLATPELFHLWLRAFDDGLAVVGAIRGESMEVKPSARLVCAV